MGIRIWFDRQVATGNTWRTLIYVFIGLISVLVVLFGLGVMLHEWRTGFSANFSLFDDSTEKFFWKLVESYLNPRDHDHDSSAGRTFFYFVETVGIILLSGILVSVFVSVYEKRKSKWETGLLRYRVSTLGRFAIVVGGNEMVPNLIGQLLNKTYTTGTGESFMLDHVLVMTSREVPKFRKQLTSELGNNEEKVVVYYGKRTSEIDLLMLHAESSQEIFVIGERLDVEQMGGHHDVKNMDCVKKIAKLLSEVSAYRSRVEHDDESRLSCHVMFEYQSTFSVFQAADVNTTISGMLKFKPFNYYEMWAQKVLVCEDLNPSLHNAQSSIAYLPLEGGKPLGPDETVHLIVVGMSRMGIALATEAARLAHYPNFIDSGRRSTITFIDSDANRQMNFFLGHYKELFAVSRWTYMEAADVDAFYKSHSLFSQVRQHSPLEDPDSLSAYKPDPSRNYTLGDRLADIDWQFVKGDLESPAVQRFISEQVQQEGVRVTIAVCFPIDNISLASSLYLPDEVFSSVGSNVVQLLVYQPNGDALMSGFSTDTGYAYQPFAKIRPFGMIEKCYDIEVQEKLEKLSEQLDKTYRSLGRKKRMSLRRELGVELSVKTKSKASQRWSNIYNGMHVWTKLRSIGYAGQASLSPEVIERLARLEHVRWYMEQLLMGFAPFKPNEQVKIKQLMGRPLTPVLQQHIDSIVGGTADETAKNAVCEWLRSWDGFDEYKEKMKSDMSHLDICSDKLLRELDSDTDGNDAAMVSSLPDLYRAIAGKHTPTEAKC